ncbi:hypothetical protein HanXRQr2_Chr09g0403571 [Helianthus annuus]|uniref:Uncharacterized protein n=1 Tax=Helianthus annuus TaxID=4232 RepID=A0A9K3NA82_HELAN|nr:hypothetical protein HanXRQr2_Chr09g0403571 [Helianthus annuus]KAJ0543588.1 hypothetical protein HanHA89_Chr09g0352311 [Helianthus annuus]KAJ0630189.1 hypothetical protein HanHA300_Chr00c0427g0763551 [Helianthus annuus]KAJ0708642.1 hypothetical protein HanLR1_Chr09g0331621 [Helianthus annuus]KAJ0894475.1 hypothetical protein HanPSC8_Chr09g0389461 [Helianthus annuus]
MKAAIVISSIPVTMIWIRSADYRRLGPVNDDGDSIVQFDRQAHVTVSRSVCGFCLESSRYRTQS